MPRLVTKKRVTRDTELVVGVLMDELATAMTNAIRDACAPIAHKHGLSREEFTVIMGRVLLFGASALLTADAELEDDKAVELYEFLMQAAGEWVQDEQNAAVGST